MNVAIANLIVVTAAGYLIIGVVFAIPFAAFAWRTISDRGTTGTLGFRMVIIPAATALWPWLLYRWIREPGGNRQT